jgi:glutamate/tyrosine decarboxylase-like PLP-dependent enzyme
VAELIERSCTQARALAERLRKAPGVEILNDVVLNQVLVRFTPSGGGDADGHTRAVVERVQKEGTCWLSGTTWQNRAAMRISVSGWSTTDDDIARSADAILKAARDPS